MNEVRSGFKLWGSEWFRGGLEHGTRLINTFSFLLLKCKFLFLFYFWHGSRRVKRSEDVSVWRIWPFSLQVITESEVWAMLAALCEFNPAELFTLGIWCAGRKEAWLILLLLPSVSPPSSRWTTWGSVENSFSLTSVRNWMVFWSVVSLK